MSINGNHLRSRRGCSPLRRSEPSHPGGSNKMHSAPSSSSCRGGGGGGERGGSRPRNRGGGGGGSRKAEARSINADLYLLDQDSASSGTEPSSSPTDLVLSQRATRFNANAPVFRPASASVLPNPKPAANDFPLPREAPPEEMPQRRRDRRERRKMSRSDQFRVPANYLLNFTYERPTFDWSLPPPRRRGHVVEFKKERFVQANYRFVVNAGGNYLHHIYEADQLVDWDEVEQIVLQTPVPYNCPICLDNPMAPKMTKCGHIYCWSCISRYLGMAQRGWRRCPICFESVSARHLKTASIELVPEHHEGDRISFTLMRRRKDCTVALPSMRWRLVETLLHHDDQDSSFSRIVLVENITSILDKEQQDLNEVLAMARASQDHEQIPYIEGAIEELRQRRDTFSTKKKCKAGNSSVSGLATEFEAREGRGKSVASSWSESEGEEEPLMHEPTTESSEDETQGITGAEVAEEAAEKKDDTEGSSAASSPEAFYFYQASDGQNIFMHPLNFRCLYKELGSFDKLPLTVEGTVLQMEEVTQNEKMRKRRKMIIGHLPLSTQFQFCEIEMSNFVSSKTLALFSDEIRFREKRREELKRERAPEATPRQIRLQKEESDPDLEEALAESRLIAATSTATASSPPAAESPAASGLQGAWAQKQQQQAGGPKTSSSSSAKPKKLPPEVVINKVPTFSQVASNTLWSGWSEDAFPVVSVQHGGQAAGKQRGSTAATGSTTQTKTRKKATVLVSNSGGRRY